MNTGQTDPTPSEPLGGSMAEKRPRKRWLRRILSAAVVMLGTASVAGGWWFHSRYRSGERLDVPIREFTKFEYPADPGARSIYCGSYQGRRLTLNQIDDVHFDFVLEPLHNHVAKIVFKNIDVSRMTPGVPAWTKSDPGLVRIALTDREWNRQQVQFQVPSPYVEVSGGNGFERERLVQASLAKNCLNAGLWEVILKVAGETGTESYYHGWFTFPLGQYKRLVEHNTGFSYWDHWYKLEHWSDPAGTFVNLDGLRHVLNESAVEARFNRDEPILVFGEQVRKKRTCNTTNVVTWGDMLDGRDVKFATFRPPGYYDDDTPWSNEYWRLATFERTFIRRVETSDGQRLDEIELVFKDKDGRSNRFFVGGVDLRKLPQLPIRQYPQGLYMPMGIGVPPFYQSYEELLAHDPQQSPYYSVLLDDHDLWIDHHKAAIDGPVLHRDKDDPNLVHLYLLSYERHTLIAHILIPLPVISLTKR